MRTIVDMATGSVNIAPDVVWRPLSIDEVKDRYGKDLLTKGRIAGRREDKEGLDEAF